MNVKVNEQHINCCKKRKSDLNSLNWLLIHICHPPHAGQYHMEIGQLQVKPECKCLSNAFLLAQSSPDKLILFKLLYFHTLFSLQWTSPALFLKSAIQLEVLEI